MLLLVLSEPTFQPPNRKLLYKFVFSKFSAPPCSYSFVPYSGDSLSWVVSGLSLESSSFTGEGVVEQLLSLSGDASGTLETVARSRWNTVLLV